MLRDVNAATEPDTLKARHVLEQLNEAARPARTPDQPVMESDRQELRPTGGTFRIQQIECVLHIGEELLSCRKTGILIEAIFVGLV